MRKIAFMGIFLLCGCGVAQQTQLNSSAKRAQEEIQNKCSFYMHVSPKEAQAWASVGEQSKQCPKGISEPWPKDKMMEISQCFSVLLDKKVRPVAYSATAYQAYMKNRTQSHEQYAAGDIGWDELGAKSAERMERYFKKGKGGSYFSFASCGNEVLAREVMPNYQYKSVLMEYMSNMSAFARKADKENMQPEDFAIGTQRMWTDFAAKEQQVMSQYQAQNAAAWRQVGQALMQSSAQSSNSFESNSSSCMFNPATNANQQCLHVTAVSQCAHYGAPCR